MTTFIETADAGASVGTTYTLGVGDFVSGTRASSTDADWYRVNLTAGTTYTFALTGTGINNLQQTALYLRDSDGNGLVYNNSGLPSSNTLMTYTATTTGNYYLAVSALLNGTIGSSYELSVAQGNRANFDVQMVAGVIDTDVSWSANPGTAATITYSFRDFLPAGYTASGHDVSTFTETTASQIATFEGVLAIFSEFANLTFQRVVPGGYSNAAQIVVGNYTDAADGAGAFAFYPGNSGTYAYGGDVWLDTLSVSTTAQPIGGYSRFAIMHEMGHALGLSHPGTYNAGPGVSITYAANAPFTQDSHQYSMMSYFDESNTGADFNGYPFTPMVADILALQNIYGANMTTRTGNTIYGFNNNTGNALYSFAAGVNAAFAIWDAGGQDSIDASGFAMAQTINLGDGTFSSIGGRTSNISIAVRAIIENAIGGSGIDTLIGNGAANTLDGRGGADQMSGGDGNDSYLIDNVEDIITEWAGGASGYDLAVITATAYTLGDNVEQGVASGACAAIGGNAQANYLYGGNSFIALTLNGGDGNDVLYGSLAGGNGLVGGAGTDTILMHGGSNTALGGLGSDVYYTYTASDVISEAGGDGFDTVYSNHDITLQAGLEQLIAYGAATTVIGNGENNIIYFAGSGPTSGIYGLGGSDVIYDGAGNDTIDGGAGSDILFATAGTNTLVGGADSDIYYLMGGTNYVIEGVSGGFDTTYSNIIGTTALFANVEQLILYGAATGGLGGTGNDYIYANSAVGAVTLDGGGGNDYLLGSANADILIGGLGNDQFDLNTGGADRIRYNIGGDMGMDIAYGFDATSGTQDRIEITGRGYNAASIGGAITLTDGGAGNTIVTFNAGTLAGTTINLLSVTVGNMSAADFMF